MKVVRKDRIIDLDKFDKVRYRESFFGSSYGYPVEAVRYHAGGGIFGGTTTIEEEIVRLTHPVAAAELVKDILDAWLNNKAVFDVDAWLENKNKKKREDEVEAEHFEDTVDPEINKTNELLRKIIESQYDLLQRLDSDKQK